MMVSEDHVSLWTFWKTIAKLSNINSLQYFISVCGYITFKWYNYFETEQYTLF